MKRKFLLVLAAILVAVSCAAGLTACGGTGEEQPQHVHTLVWHKAKEPACTEDGNLEYWTCSECGKYFLDAEGSKEVTDPDTLLLPGSHSLVYYEENEASCTKDGNIAYWQCEKCGRYFADENGEKELTSVTIEGKHELQHFDALAPTCTEGGNSEYWQCVKCYLLFSDADGTEPIDSATLPAAGHSMDYSSEILPSCTQSGQYGFYHCTVCEKDYWDAEGVNPVASAEDLIIPANGHRMSYTDYLAPTCTSSGNLENWYCVDCGNYYSDESGTMLIEGSVYLDPLGHEMIFHAAKDATCTEDGNSAYYECTRCHLYFQDEQGTLQVPGGNPFIPAAHQPLVQVSRVEPTCTSEGSIGYWECPACHDKFYDWLGNEKIEDEADIVLPMRDHGPSYNAASAVTCTQNGYREYWYCYNCGQYFADAEAQTVISWEDIVIPATGHENMEYHAAVQPGCLTKGNTEYWSCPDCGKYFSDESGNTEIAADSWIIAATGHTYSDEWTKDESFHWHAATCGHDEEVSGKEAHDFRDRVCTVCGYTIDYTAGLEYVLNEEGTGYEVSGIGLVTDEEIIVPSEHLGLPVTGIAASAFESCKSLYSLVLPDSVVTVGEKAFNYCSNLSEIAFGDSLTGIAASAFAGCASLQEIVLPDSLVTIGEKAFYQCENLAEVTFGNGLLEIGNSAFCFCGVEKVVVPDSVVSIGQSAFSNCVSLSELTLGVNLREIGLDAFFSSYNLSVLYYNAEYVPNFDYQNGVFDEAGRDSGGVVAIFGDTVKNIPDHLFSGYLKGSNIKEIRLNENVERLGAGLFSGRGLKEFRIPSGVKEIGTKAFAYNDLTTITIPENVTLIDDSAFYECRRLIEVYNKSSLDIKPADWQNGHVAYYAKNVYTPTSGCSRITNTEDGYRFYKDDRYAALFDYTGTDADLVLPDGFVAWDGTEVTSYYVNAYTFQERDDILSVVFPDSVSYIEQNAFYASSVESIVMSVSLDLIYDGAFGGCTNLTHVYYEGTAEQWAEITFSVWAEESNQELTEAPRSYYRAEDPYLDGTAVEGETYWYYDTDGKTPVLWTVS